MRYIIVLESVDYILGTLRKLWEAPDTIYKRYNHIKGMARSVTITVNLLRRGSMELGTSDALTCELLLTSALRRCRRTCRQWRSVGSCPPSGRRT